MLRQIGDPMVHVHDKEMDPLSVSCVFFCLSLFKRDARALAHVFRARGIGTMMALCVSIVFFVSSLLGVFLVLLRLRLGERFPTHCQLQLPCRNRFRTSKPLQPEIRVCRVREQATWTDGIFLPPLPPHTHTRTHPWWPGRQSRVVRGGGRTA